MKTSDLIKKQRESLGLTLEQVGEYVGVGKSTVRKWEFGSIKNMRRDKISKLAEILQLSPLDLMTEDNAASHQIDDSNKPLVKNLDLARWLGDLLNNDDPDIHELLKIISTLDTDEIKTLLVMARALKK